MKLPYPVFDAICVDKGEQNLQYHTGNAQKHRIIVSGEDKNDALNALMDDDYVTLRCVRITEVFSSKRGIHSVE